MKICRLFFLGLGLAILTSCHHQPTFPAPNTIMAPTPLEGNHGEYMCPYTSDGTVCGWIEAGMGAKMGASIGSAVGAYAGSKALEQIPIVGGFIGQKVGNEIGRQIAIKSMGGEEAIKEGSDLSFNSVEDLAVYIYVKHSTHPDYQGVVDLLGELYPEYKEKHMYAILSAPPAVVSAGTSSFAQSGGALGAAQNISGAPNGAATNGSAAVQVAPHDTFRTTDQNGKVIFIRLKPAVSQ